MWLPSLHCFCITYDTIYVSVNKWPQVRIWDIVVYSHAWLLILTLFQTLLIDFQFDRTDFDKLCILNEQLCEKMEWNFILDQVMLFTCHANL